MKLLRILQWGVDHVPSLPECKERDVLHRHLKEELETEEWASNLSRNQRAFEKTLTPEQLELYRKL